MWDFLKALLDVGGVLPLLLLAAFGAIYFQTSRLIKSDKKIDELHQQLLESVEKRLEDTKDNAEAYKQLTRDFEKTSNLLIAVYKKDRDYGRDYDR